MPITPIPKEEPRTEVKFINVDATVNPYNSAVENTLILMRERIQVLEVRVVTLEATLNALVEALRAR